MSVHIYMVRHGETYFNFLHRFQGWSDAPLTEKGIQDGYHAGTRLANVHFDGAYSSDLTRAIHTARYILTNNAASNFSDPTQLLISEKKILVPLKVLAVKLYSQR